MKPTIIGIAGGTASGKTTIAKRLYEETLKYGPSALIKLDDYYFNKDKIVISELGNPNYDHPDSYDSKLILQHLDDLKKGKPIKKPLYDFVNHCRKKEYEEIEPSKIIIVEGIMTFAFPKLRELFDIKIFVDTEDDIRFIRRVKRDMKERGRTLESVIEQYLDTVKPMHNAFVEPSKKFADIIIPEGGYNDVAFEVLTSMVEKIHKK